MCGWGPARPVKFNSVQGIIIWWQWGTIEARLCKLCSTAAYNEAQRSTLTRGWWGIIAPIATIVAFVGNLSRVGAVKSLRPPQGKSPNVTALLPIPMIFATPWYRRPLVWVSTGIAALILAWVTLGALSETNPRAETTLTTPSTSTNASDPATPSRPTSGSSPTNRSAPRATPNTSSNGVGTCWDEQGSSGRLLQVDCNDISADWRGEISRSSGLFCPGRASAYLERSPGVFHCLAPI